MIENLQLIDALKFCIEYFPSGLLVICFVIIFHDMVSVITNPAEGAIRNFVVF